MLPLQGAQVRSLVELKSHISCSVTKNNNDNKIKNKTSIKEDWLTEKEVACFAASSSRITRQCWSSNEHLCSGYLGRAGGSFCFCFGLLWDKA